MRGNPLSHLYRPAVPDEYGPQAREMLRQLLDRVNFLLERSAGGAGTQKIDQVTIAPPPRALPPMVTIQAATDAQTSGSTLVGFGVSQPFSPNASVAITGSGIGLALSGTSSSITISVTSPSTFRAAVSAAQSGANTDITSLTGLTGQVKAAAGSTIDFGRVVVAMAADADQTLAGTEYNNLIIEMTGGTTLTATRNIILPTISGTVWIVENTTSGGQSLVFKTSGGTGVTVANGNRAIIYGDGTNIKQAAN